MNTEQILLETPIPKPKMLIKLTKPVLDGLGKEELIYVINKIYDDYTYRVDFLDTVYSRYEKLLEHIAELKDNKDNKPTREPLEGFLNHLIDQYEKLEAKYEDLLTKQH